MIVLCGSPRSLWSFERSRRRLNVWPDDVQRWTTCWGFVCYNFTGCGNGKRQRGLRIDFGRMTLDDRGQFECVFEEPIRPQTCTRRRRYFSRAHRQCRRGRKVQHLCNYTAFMSMKSMLYKGKLGGRRRQYCVEFPRASLAVACPLLVHYLSSSCDHDIHHLHPLRDTPTTARNGVL